MFKNIILPILLTIIMCFVIYVVLFVVFLGENDINYWGFLPISSEDGYKNSFNLRTSFDNFGGWGNIDCKKSVTANYLLKKKYDGTEKANFIIGYLDYLSYFNSKTISIKKQNIKRVKDGCFRSLLSENEIYVDIVLPYVPLLTARLVPVGERLIVQGLDTVSSKFIKHKYVDEYRYIGNFNQIGFTLNNNSWFKRNTSRRYVFYGQKPKQYGSLSIFVDQNNVRSFMIYYVKDAGKEGYDKHFPELEKALESLETYGCYGRAVDRTQK